MFASSTIGMALLASAKFCNEKEVRKLKEWTFVKNKEDATSHVWRTHFFYLTVVEIDQLLFLIEELLRDITEPAEGVLKGLRPRQVEYD